MSDHDPVFDETERLLEAEYLRVMRIEPRLRRFVRALTELGAPVPADWATTADGESFDFTALTSKQFDRLVCLVEDLAANRPITVTIQRGGPTLFDPGAPTGPSVSPTTSSIHIVVPS